MIMSNKENQTEAGPAAQVEMPVSLKRPRGRPKKDLASKRATRNKREKLRRKERREALEKDPVATTPFTRGFQLLDQVPEATEVTVATGTGLVTFAPILIHKLSEKQIDHALSTYETLKRWNTQGFADATVKMIRQDWRHWQAFCAEHQRQVLPVLADDLKTFIWLLVKAGYKRSTLEHILFTITVWSDLHQAECPTLQKHFKMFWKDLCRYHLTMVKKQAPGLTLTMLEAMEASCNPDSALDVRDMAMASVLYDGAMRKSEVVKLKWGDIAQADDGGLATIRESKTDQEHKGHEFYLRPVTMAWLKRWKAFSDETIRWVFHSVRPDVVAKAIAKAKVLEEASSPMSNDVAEITGTTNAEKPKVPPCRMNVKAVDAALFRLAKIAGLDDIGFTGHSGRVGAAQDMTDWGMSLSEIMQIGRWATPQMPAHYASRRMAIDAGKGRFERALSRRRKG